MIDQNQKSETGSAEELSDTVHQLDRTCQLIVRELLTCELSSQICRQDRAPRL